MKNIYTTGDKKTYRKVVTKEDVARFDSGTVHEVYATFALARDAEWSSRLFVLDMKDEDEEGIGTFVHINHHAPALIGEEVVFEATLEELKGNTVNCRITVTAGQRLIATGRTGQKILKKDKIKNLFNTIQKH
ncbi:MAG: hypothetical protein NZM35_05485 [Chitinophagales bacterium]|nr:hypothetical protein [Chitinophagales bacterium]MDW8417897.1 hotdog domain-containing protein [Chitinophagales bacterium]